MSQLQEVVRKRRRLPKSAIITLDQAMAFLNSPAPSQEGVRGEIRSLWSSVRASLTYTHSSILISPESASVHCGDTKVHWHKRHEVNYVLKPATYQRHLTNLLEATDQGRTTYSITLAEASNYFVYSGAFLMFPQYRFALRSHLNLLPTRTVKARSGTLTPDTNCRICHQQPETLAHLINHCHYNLGMVRERHNVVLERVTRAIPPSLGDKYKEQPLPNTTGANRPDLTIISPDSSSVILLDVCIPFEGHPQALQEAAQSKLTK